MKARIYQPARSATQSAKFNFWLLEFDSNEKPLSKFLICIKNHHVIWEYVNDDLP